MGCIKLKCVAKYNLDDFTETNWWDFVGNCLSNIGGCIKLECVAKYNLDDFTETNWWDFVGNCKVEISLDQSGINTSVKIERF